jgi:hypothetical protein
MAAVVVALLNVTRVNDAEALGTVWLALGGGKAALETDFKYQSAASVSSKVSTTEGGVKYYNSGASHDLSGPDRVVLFKHLITNIGVLNALGSTGEILEVGNGNRTNYYRYYVQGAATYPPLRSWLVTPIDPNQASYRDATVGTLDLNVADFYAHAATFSASSKAENVAMDAIDLVTYGGGLKLTRGDGADPDGTFEDFITFDVGTSTNRYGITFRAATAELDVFGTLTIGESGTATVFRSTGDVLVFPDGKFSGGFQGLAFDIQNASTDIDLVAVQVIGKGQAITKQFFDTALQVDGTGEVITSPAHGLVTADLVTYSKEGGSHAIGLTDATTYWIRALTANTVAMYSTRQNSVTDASRIGLTAGSAPGENHSLVRVNDTRPDITITGTSGDFDTRACTFDGIRIFTLTSQCSLVGGFMRRTGNVVLAAGAVDSVEIESATVTEGAALVDPATTLATITDCLFTAAPRGHAVRVNTTGTFAHVGNVYTGFWAPAVDGWKFGTTSGVNGSTEVVTTNAAHGFTTGDEVFYNKEGGSASIGLTDLAKYYVNVITTTTVSLHRTRAAATADSSRIDLTASGSETHSLYSGRASVFNDSGGLVTINISGGGAGLSVRNGSGATTAVNNTKTLTLTNLIAGSEVRIFRISDSVELGGVESSGTSFAHAYTYVSDVAVYIIVQKTNYEWQRLDETLGADDKTVRVLQRADLNYANP